MLTKDVLNLSKILLDGDHQTAINFVNNHGYSSRFSVYNDLLTPAMRYVGELWENNEITVADEHLATATCDFVLSRLFPSTQTNISKKKAMFFCLEGEQHYIGLKMVNSLFEEYEWDTQYYGSNLPLEYALKNAEKWKPDLVGISVTIVYHLSMLEDYTKAFASLASPPILMVGGRLTERYNIQDYCTGEPIILNNLSDVKVWLNRYGMGASMNV
ncbi:B12-binding domain-containing protein [Peribacillus sp. SCS-155]|uniref:cobalamin B12-binding domain-containing protein n=1 Tax=Peribacillus sedimenti TaxID=3115297 RepID=UPI00390657E8